MFHPTRPADSFCHALSLLSTLAVLCASASFGQLLPHSAVSIPAPSAADQRFGSAAAHGDFNDDSLQDLAVAASNGVRIFLGSASGLTSEYLLPFSVGSQISLAICDLDPNRPGEELMIGLGKDNVTHDGVTHTTAGRVLVLAITGMGPVITADFHQGVVAVDDPTVDLESNDEFGSALATGDFNRDGFCDLAVGAPGENYTGASDSGSVHVFLGPLATGTFLPQIEQGTKVSGLPDSRESGDRLGSTLALLPRFSGEVRLAIGAPLEDMDATDDGAVWVVDFDGVSGEFDQANARLLSLQGSTGVPASNDARFGAALAVGRVDPSQNLHPDLVIGSPGAGRVSVFDGLGLDFDDDISQNDAGNPEPDQEFGAALAVGDIDGNYRDEIAIGAPGNATGDGAVFVFENRSTGKVLRHTIRRNNLVPVPSGTGAAFGTLLVASDLDADGTMNLIVGAPKAAQISRGETPPPGEVHLIPSVGRMVSGTIVVEAGDSLSDHSNRGGTTLLDLGPPASSSTQFALRTQTAASMQVITSIGIAGSGNINLDVAVDGSARTSWIDFVTQEVIDAPGGVRARDGDAVPGGGTLPVDSQGQLVGSESGVLHYLYNERQLYKIALDGTTELLLNEGQELGTSRDGDRGTVAESGVQIVLTVAPSETGDSYLASLLHTGVQALAQDGVLIWEGDLDTIDGELVDPNGPVALRAARGIWAGTTSGGTQIVADRSGAVFQADDDDLGVLELAGTSVRQLELGQDGQVIALWRNSNNAMIVSSCDLSGEVVTAIPVRSGDRLDTDGDGLADTTITEIQNISAPAAFGLAALTNILHDGSDELIHEALLTLAWGECPFFSDGFENGDLGGWTSSAP